MKILLIFFGLLLLHIFILVNLQFTAWPEMFSYPYFLNNGFNLYKDIALPYQPLLVIVLSLVYKLFGYNILVLQFFTWGIILLSDTLIFIISRKIIGKKYFNLLPLLLYVIIQPLTGGNMLWFDLAATPFILLAILMSFNKKYLMVGIFLGLAFFIKQQNGVAAAFVLLYFLLTKRINEIGKLLIGLVVVTLPVLIYVALNGIFSDYYFWTTVVPLLWYPRFPGYSNWPALQEIIKLACLFGVGTVLALKNWRLNDNRKIVLLIFIALFITAFPRFDFFRFQPAIAVYIILLASLLTSLKNKLLLCLPIVLVAIILAVNSNTFNKPTRFYGDEEISLASEINKETTNNQKVYLLGVNSIEYLLSSRLTSKPWIDNYVWYMEIDGVQEKVLKGFEKEAPELVLWKIPNSGKWYEIGVYQPKKIADYIRRNYKKERELQGIEIWKRKD